MSENIEVRFASYPSAVVYREAGSTATKNAAQHLLWGDYLRLTGPPKVVRGKTWHPVRARGVSGWMLEGDFGPERLLEINFVDIGQGDGCLMVTPDDKFVVVDAGEGDNMYRFLRWRFGRLREDVEFESFVITHPDKDHYQGFKKLLDHPRVKVGTVFHNGIVERKADRTLGPESDLDGTVKVVDRREFDGRIYLDDVIRDLRGLKRVLRAEERAGSRKLYSRLLRTAVEGGRVGTVRMLSSEDGFLPGYGPDDRMTVRVLAPVPEVGADGKRRLRRLGSDGETKNGHSVALKLTYGAASFLLGGDLNIPAENYLLEHYTGKDPENTLARDLPKLVTEARKTFEVDVAKACHHGSADLSETYIAAVNATATVISSGDEESHSHPRPDALGAFGRHGRGKRPLLFSTELARSGRETIKHPNVLRRRIEELRKTAREGETAEIRAAAELRLSELLDVSLERSVAVYGMITVRSDGERVIIAQKLEKPRSNKSKWDIYELEPGPGGHLAFTPDHGH